MAKLPDTIDSAQDLSDFTVDQIRVLNRSLETVLLEILADTAACDRMSDDEKSKVLDAIGFLTRTGQEILRREKMTPGPCGICWETLPDGSAPVRLSFCVLAF